MSDIKAKRNLVIPLFFLVVTLFLIGMVGATQYQLICLDRAQTIRFSQCNPSMKDRTCDSTSCPFCVSVISNGVYCPALINTCNGLSLACTPINGSSVDKQPPTIQILNPVQNATYSGSRSMLLTLDISEQADVTMLDLINGHGKWSQVCNNCFSYNKTRMFNEGFNMFSIRATDGANNTGEDNVSFFIDTIKPKINKITPSKGFANGSFIIDFQEQNPKSLSVYYKLINGTLNHQDINLSQCNNTNGKDKYLCNTNVDLSAFNNKTIMVSVNLTDIANQQASIKQFSLFVDVIPPNLSVSYNLTSNKLNAVFNVIESNFDSVRYIDHSLPSPRWNTICSFIKNGSCSKTLFLSKGNHSLDFAALDKAGNSAIKHVDIPI